MKITVKTLKGDILNIEAEPTSTVNVFLSRFSSLKIKSKLLKDFRYNPKKLYIKEKPQIIKTLYKNST
jgi:energy-converting hydrogenase Eha subunit F